MTRWEMKMAYIWGGFVVAPVGLWLLPRMSGDWDFLVFFITVAFFLHVIAYVILWFVIASVVGGMWEVLALAAIVGSILFAIGWGFNNVVDDLAARFPRRDQQPQQSPQQVHHYHHVTTDKDLQAEVTDVQRDDRWPGWDPDDPNDPYK